MSHNFIAWPCICVWLGTFDIALLPLWNSFVSSQRSELHGLGYCYVKYLPSLTNICQTKSKLAKAILSLHIFIESDFSHSPLYCFNKCKWSYSQLWNLTEFSSMIGIIVNKELKKRSTPGHSLKHSEQNPKYKIFFIVELLHLIW